MMLLSVHASASSLHINIFRLRPLLSSVEGSPMISYVNFLELPSILSIHDPGPMPDQLSSQSVSVKDQCLLRL